MTEEIRIGYLSTLYHTSLIMKGSDLAGELGVGVSWRLFPTGPDMIDAFGREELDLGYLGLPPAIIGIGRGLKIRCIAGGHMEGTVLVGLAGIRPRGTVRESLAQFRGRSIGTPKRGSIHDVILRQMVTSAGFEDEIEIKNYDWADFILDAMIDGEVEGGCGTPPLAVLAIQKLSAEIVLPPELMWPKNPSYGIVATEELIEGSPRFLEGFLRRHEDASNLIRTRPLVAAGMVAEALPTIDADFALEVYRLSPKYCASLSREYIDATMAFASLLKETGAIPGEVKAGEIFEMTAIERVHPEGDHYRDPGNL